MALSAADNRTYHGPDSFGRFTVANGVTIYKGALVGLVVGTGTVTNYDDASGHLFLGYALRKVVGDGTLQLDVQLRGDILRDVTVAGVSGAAQNGREVYATDENTFTLTRPADDAQPVGLVLDADASNCDVLLFSMKEAALLSLAGGSKQAVHLATIHTTALEGTSALDLRTSMPLWGHGVIKSFYAWPTGFDSRYSSGASQALNLEIGGTNVTGGVLTLAFSDCNGSGDVGTKIAATAITANNEFNDGDLLDIELASGGTGFTASVDTVSFELWADVEYRAGN